MESPWRGDPYKWDGVYIIRHAARTGYNNHNVCSTTDLAIEAGSLKLVDPQSKDTSLPGKSQ